MSLNQFILSGGRWAAMGPVTGMDFTNTLWKSGAQFCEWNIQTMHVSQKVILLQLAIGNMVVKVVYKCLDFNPSNNSVMIGIIVPILQAVNRG